MNKLLIKFSEFKYVKKEGTKLAFRAAPLVPDADAVLLQVLYVRLAAYEPEQFVYDRAQVQFLGGDDGEALREVEPHLVAEDAEGPRSRPVLFLDAVPQNVFEVIQVLSHSSFPHRVRSPWPDWKKSRRDVI